MTAMTLVEQPFPVCQTSVTGKIKGSEPQQWQFKINNFLESSACQHHGIIANTVLEINKTYNLLKKRVVFFRQVRYSVLISVRFNHNNLSKSQPGALNRGLLTLKGLCLSVFTVTFEPSDHWEKVKNNINERT